MSKPCVCVVCGHTRLMEMTGVYDGSIAGLSLTFERDRTHSILASIAQKSKGNDADGNDSEAGGGSSGVLEPSLRVDEAHAAVAADVGLNDAAQTDAIAQAIADARNAALESCAGELARAREEAAESRLTIQRLYEEHKHTLQSRRQAIEDAEREILESCEEDYLEREEQRQVEHSAATRLLEQRIAELEAQGARWKHANEEVERKHREAIESCEEAITACRLGEQETESARREMGQEIARTASEQQVSSEQEQQAKHALREERVRTAETLDAMKASWARKLQDAQTQHMEELVSRVAEARKTVFDSCEADRRRTEQRLNAENRRAIQTCEEAIATCEAQEAASVEELQAAKPEWAREAAAAESARLELTNELENERNLRNYTESLLWEEQAARAELLSKDSAFMEALEGGLGMEMGLGGGGGSGALLELEPQLFDEELNEMMESKVEVEAARARAAQSELEVARLQEELLQQQSKGSGGGGGVE